MSGLMSGGEEDSPSHIYENVGECYPGDEDDAGWGSSEFEDFGDDLGDRDRDERGSVGAGSHGSQSSVDRAVNRTKNILRRVAPIRLSWGKPGAADLQSMVRSCSVVFCLLGDWQ